MKLKIENDDGLLTNYECYVLVIDTLSGPSIENHYRPTCCSRPQICEATISTADEGIETYPTDVSGSARRVKLQGMREIQRLG